MGAAMAGNGNLVRLASSAFADVISARRATFAAARSCRSLATYAAMSAFSCWTAGVVIAVYRRASTWTVVHGKPVFVLPQQTIGTVRERVVLAGDGRTVVYAQAGTLDEWKQHIGNPAGAHLLLQFGVACAFAATLLQMSGGESGGFHLHEFSSKGKTTVQQVAASVWGSGALNGGFIRRWRATAK